MDKRVLWKIDDAEDLPLAVIEDTSEGMGVCDIGRRTKRNLSIAKEIVENHNKYAR